MKRSRLKHKKSPGRKDASTSSSCANPNTSLKKTCVEETTTVVNHNGGQPNKTTVSCLGKRQKLFYKDLFLDRTMCFQI